MTVQPHFFKSAKIVFGWGVLDQLAQLKVSRVALITDRSSMEPLGFLDKAVSYLHQAGAEVEVLDSVEGEPTINAVLTRLDTVCAFAPDAFVALGGGSVMDVAKGLRLLYDHPGASIEDYMTFFSLPWFEKRTPLITVPSTSGTGSETTIVAVFTDPEKKMKRLMLSRDIQADVALVDPELPSHMPPSLTANTGMDCLCQAIESLVTSMATEFTRAMGLQAIRLAFENLPVAYRDSSPKARENMHYASTISALSMTNSNAGLGHAMDQIGPLYGLPHGFVVAVLLPYTIEFNWRQAPEHYVRAARVLDIYDSSPSVAVGKLVGRVDKLLSEINIPGSFKEAGVEEEDFLAQLDTLVQWTLENGAGQMSPRPPSAEEARQLFLDVFYGNRRGLS